MSGCNTPPPPELLVHPPPPTQSFWTPSHNGTWHYSETHTIIYTLTRSGMKTVEQLKALEGSVEKLPYKRKAVYKASLEFLQRPTPEAQLIKGSKLDTVE